MRISRRLVIAIIVALPLLGVMIAGFGLIGVDARSGHWRATEWVLHWAMRSSVRTAALGTEAGEPVDAEAVLPMAAGHFERGCAICHGSPAEVRSPAVMAMLPVPPDLATVVDSWSDAELFVIVKDGVRYTGMPAWPADGRGDEVRAMVAFLRRLPGMSAADYAKLAAGARGDDLIGYCQSCHGTEKLSPAAPVPSLDGQSEAYLAASLRAYAAGARPSGIMAVAAAGLDETEIAEAARFYASRPAQVRPATDTLAGGDDRAARLARSGDPERKIAACNRCHDGRNPAYPLIAGQSAAYIAAQLRLFRDGKRGGTAHHDLMHAASRTLEDRDIEALADHFGG